MVNLVPLVCTACACVGTFGPNLHSLRQDIATGELAAVTTINGESFIEKAVGPTACASYFGSDWEAAVSPEGLAEVLSYKPLAIDVDETACRFEGGCYSGTAALREEGIEFNLKVEWVIGAESESFIAKARGRNKEVYPVTLQDKCEQYPATTIPIAVQLSPSSNIKVLVELNPLAALPPPSVLEAPVALPLPAEPEGVCPQAFDGSLLTGLFEAPSTAFEADPDATVFAMKQALAQVFDTASVRLSSPRLVEVAANQGPGRRLLREANTSRRLEQVEPAPVSRFSVSFQSGFISSSAAAAAITSLSAPRSFGLIAEAAGATGTTLRVVDLKYSPNGLLDGVTGRSSTLDLGSPAPAGSPTDAGPAWFLLFVFASAMGTLVVALAVQWCWLKATAKTAKEALPGMTSDHEETKEGDVACDREEKSEWNATPPITLPSSRVPAPFHGEALEKKPASGFMVGALRAAAATFGVKKRSSGENLLGSRDSATIEEGGVDISDDSGEGEGEALSSEDEFEVKDELDAFPLVEAGGVTAVKAKDGDSSDAESSDEFTAATAAADRTVESGWVIAGGDAETDNESATELPLDSSRRTLHVLASASASAGASKDPPVRGKGEALQSAVGDAGFKARSAAAQAFAAKPKPGAVVVNRRAPEAKSSSGKVKGAVAVRRVDMVKTPSKVATPMVEVKASKKRILTRGPESYEHPLRNMTSGLSSRFSLQQLQAREEAARKAEGVKAAGAKVDAAASVSGNGGQGSLMPSLPMRPASVAGKPSQRENREELPPQDHCSLMGGRYPKSPANSVSDVATTIAAMERRGSKVRGAKELHNEPKPLIQHTSVLDVLAKSSTLDVEDLRPPASGTGIFGKLKELGKSFIRMKEEEQAPAPQKNPGRHSLYGQTMGNDVMPKSRRDEAKLEAARLQAKTFMKEVKESGQKAEPLYVAAPRL